MLINQKVREIQDSKKEVKKFEKGVDREGEPCYYVQARLRATNLENDTEQGKQERKQSMN